MNKAYFSVQPMRGCESPPLPVLRSNYDPAKLLECQKETEILKNEISELKSEIHHLRKKEKESIKAEIQYKQLIRTYQQELSKPPLLPSKMPTEESEKNLSVITDAYDKVYGCIKQLQERINDMLVSKEITLVAVFNARLQEISNELENEKKEKLEYIENLAERESNSVKELGLLKGSVELVEAKNSFLEVENKRLKGELKQLKTEYDILEHRLFEMKLTKSKPRLASPRSIISPTSAPSILTSPPVSPGSRIKSFISPNRSAEESTDARYQLVIEKLKKSVRDQKSSLRAARTAYIRELQSKNEIENVIQTCIDSVKKQLVNCKDKSKNKAELVKQELIDKLTTQEEILSLLYQKVQRKN
ncbi:unnamed protein product [Blepharisma stoltei]|uniref:Uncharacterized protein n=1 Tax=Blepharisma stoltei TaxID=1481888 RepID=A0AAU9J416_9CILI|nr:unnamed protein product [Blepharisma stoltei]